MQVLWTDIKSEDTFDALVASPGQPCAISTPRGAYKPIIISALGSCRTHCHLCPTRYLFTPERDEAREGEVPCPRTQHLTNVQTLKVEKHDISLNKKTSGY